MPPLDAPRAVLGVGVCAAALKSLEQLFTELAPGNGIACLIAVRQQEGLSVDTVVAALKAVSQLRVAIAADGEPLRADHIYVGGPEDQITIEDGHVGVRRATEPIGHRGTVDSMLISLAEHAHDRAIAVILAGLGSDGTAGITATKQFGGLSIAEVADGSEGSQAVATGPASVADLHLSLQEIPTHIAQYAASRGPVSDGPEAEEVGAEIDAQVTQITTILRNVTGHDFHGYKRGTFIRRIQRRMQVMQIDGIESYLKRLRADRDEVLDLFQDLLIGVTQFFRDPAEFELLEREIPGLFSGKGPGDQFRVWVLGCATGEEAYSIAILLREHMATLDHPPEVQIFATDLDARALGLARAGRYSSDAVTAHVPPARLARWFVREGNTYCVSKELREMCVFSPHNIVKDAPFSRIDILSCRNLLIYLNAELQNRVIPIFHFALRGGGVLFLGTSENVTRQQKLFTPVDRKFRVFRRLETAARVIPDFPLTSHRAAGSASGALAAAEPAGRLSIPVTQQAEAIAERYAPPYVVVDVQGDVLHFSGRTGRYLEPTAGAANLNILSLVHRDLRIELRSALQRAVAEARRIELPRLLLKQDERTQGVNLIVEPMGKGDVSSLVIIFQETAIEAPAPQGDRLVDDEQHQQLENELRVTRDRLQATIEELESTNEELKSSNEEYQSINEELQSASEEMETSKEELQSMNEELQTVNSELGHRVAELASTNSDIRNLLESTQIATVFLDNDLRVRNFTPAATDVFHLLETDMGRPLDHVVSRVKYPELAGDIRRVMKTLVPVEREVSDPVENRRFAVRVLPYRSVDNYIGGSVVTFTDLTAVYQAEDALRQSEQSYRVLFESIDEGFCVVEVLFDERNQPVDYRFIEANPAFQRQMGLAAPVNRTMRELVADRDHRWLEVYGRVAITGQPARFENEAVSLGRWHDIHAFRIGEPSQRRVAILARDVLERRLAERALHESEDRLQRVLETDAVSVLFFDRDGILTQANEVFLRMTGHTRDDIQGRTLSWQRMTPPEWHAESQAQLARLRATGRIGPYEKEYLRKDGSRAWMLFAGRDLGDGSVVEIGVDISDRKRAEGTLRESEERFRQFGEASQSVLSIRDAGTFCWEYLNPAFETVYGLDRQTAQQGDHLARWLERILPEDRESVRENLRRVRGGERMTFDYRITRAADQQLRWIRNTDFPIHDGAGNVVRIGGIDQDVTEVRHTADALAAAEARQRAVVEGILQLVWRATRSGEWIWASPQWTEETGQPLEQSLAWGWLAMLHPDDRDRAREHWSKAAAAGSFELEWRILHAASGGYRWYRARAAAVKDDRGAVVEWLGTSTDVDEQHLLQERQRILVAELQHRTRNLLGVIRSIAEKTGESAADYAEFRARFADRLEALARVQGLLSRLSEADRVTFDELLDSELAAMDCDRQRVTLDGPRGVRLRSSTLQTLALALHELATNAVKFGALGPKPGHLAVTWSLRTDKEGERRLHVDWRETGVVMKPAAQAAKSGQGRELIERALPYQLNAHTTYAFDAGGVHCTISIPVSRTGGSPAAQALVETRDS